MKNSTLFVTATSIGLVLMGGLAVAAYAETHWLRPRSMMSERLAIKVAEMKRAGVSPLHYLNTRRPVQAEETESAPSTAGGSHAAALIFGDGEMLGVHGARPATIIVGGM